MIEKLFLDRMSLIIIGFANFSLANSNTLWLLKRSFHIITNTNLI